MTTPASDHDHNPPQWAERMLRWMLSPANRDTITGDLLEEYREVVLPTRGVVGARRWYLRQAGSLMVASNSALQWVIWLIASGALLIAFVMRHHVEPPFPGAGWATLAVAATAMYSLRAIDVRVLWSLSLGFGLAFVAVAATASVGAAILSPLPDVSAVLMAYSGLRGQVLVACYASVLIAAGFQGASRCRRIGVGLLTAMGTAAVGALSWTLVVTSLARLFPSLLDQLGPLSTFARPTVPFNLTIVLVHSLGSWLQIVMLSLLPGLMGAMLWKALAITRDQRSLPSRPATS